MATILIADDQPTNREVLVAILRAQGHHLIEAADGSEGLAAVRAQRPDLVITDVLMPVMDGYEFVRQLRLDPATRGMPVVFYTAHYGAREARALALASGVSYILTKPAAAAEVLRIVGCALAGESETGMPPDDAPLTVAFERDHLRLLTDKLAEKADDLRTSNARLRALINIGLELASQRDPAQLLHSVCVTARDLFAATYVTLGILERHERTIERLVTCGSDEAEYSIKIGDALSGILETVVTERRPVRGENPGGSQADWRPPWLRPAIQTYLAAPIASPTHVYGWICLVGNEGGTFTENDEHLVLALSGLVGRIYENDYFAAVVQKERDRAQLYLDTAEVILLALDLEGKIRLINRKGCSLLGLPECDLIGHDFIDTCLPAQVRIEMRAKFRSAAAGDLSIVVTPLLTRSGEKRLIEWRNTLLREGAGPVIGTFSSGSDITDRHQAVEALRAAEERMRFALEAAGVGIWDIDPATKEVRWTTILESQCGLQPGTFGGTLAAFIELVHRDDRAALTETIEKAMKSGADFSVQYRAVWPDGTTRWLNGAGRFQLGAHGEAVRGLGISLDVTARHTLEAQYQQAQKMDAIGRLAGGVAHDFNNLLSAILGYCELLLTDLDPDDARQRDIVEIQKAGTSAARLTRQLLAFSRKEIIEPTAIDLNGVVTEMRTLLDRLIQEDVTVVLRLCPDLAPMMADRGQVEQIIVNLAVNARDAMPRGGTMTIETANVRLDEDYAQTHLTAKPGAYVALTVTDTGGGMTPEVQARLFEPFFTTKPVGKGTGLGLATVHGIVARCGGSVNVYSEVGRGTSFKIYFPRTYAAAIVIEAPAVDRPHVGVETVLVVEDADGLRLLAKRLLERQGYTVLVAANAEDAVQVFAQHASIDVMLTDVVMPGASGPELTKRLLEQYPALKVVYMSGYTEESIVHHGVLNPGIAFLHKPFTSETLGQKIRQALDG